MKTGIKNGILVIAIMGLLGVPAVSFAGIFNNYSNYGCGAQITRTLQVGDENSDVYTLQDFLSQRGYLYATPNGYFGPATYSAVMSFQRDNGIYTIGTVGQTTLDAVNSNICGNGSYSYGSNTYGVNNTYNASYNGSNYGYSSGTTYVNTYDPYVKNITSTVVTNSVANPSYSYGTTNSNYSTYNPVTTNTVVTPATTNASFTYGTNIVYSPNLGYTYGLIPQPGTLNITSPGTDSHYNEGDSVNISWTTSNINASQYQILLENSSGQSKFIITTSSNSATFVLTKDILDYLCTGSCADNYSQGSYKIVVATPLTDIAGNTSMFRAAVSPIFIKRPYTFYGNVNITSSKNPVSSGEVFKLYINVPSSRYYDASIYGQYSLRIHAVCPIANVQVTVAGIPCGQEFSMPFTLNSAQQEIPAMITNSTYYKQDVVFIANITNPLGQVVGTAQTTVTGNAMPIAW